MRAHQHSGRAARCLLLLGVIAALISTARAQPATGFEWLITAENKNQATQQSVELSKLVSRTNAVGIAPGGGGVTANVINDPQFEATFNTWANVYKKSYATQGEKRVAMENFKNNLVEIAAVNADKRVNHFLSGNKFSDLSYQQFAAKILMKPKFGVPREEDLNMRPGRKLQQSVDDLPKQVDWRNQGKVTAVKDQGDCGSCWAFSGVGALESAHMIKYGTTPSQTELSEQQINSCLSFTSGYDSEGCDGGWPSEVFDYAKEYNLTTSALYPYTDGDLGDTSSCRRTVLSGTRNGQVIKLGTPHIQKIETYSERALMEAVIRGPVSFAFDVRSDFMQYKGGVYMATTCGISRNHAMLLVGYNRNAETPYWIIKNSWGTGWGISGYMYVKMTGDSYGPCGMYLSSWQPTFEFSQSLTDGGQDPTPGPTPTSRPPPPAGSCEDKYNPAINCGALNQEICNTYRSFFEVNCPKSCGFCGGPAPTRSPPPPPPRKLSPPPPSGGGGGCTDDYKDCGYWAQQGYCRSGQQYYTFMQLYCKKSCNTCNQCVNLEKPANCKYWQQQGFCRTSSVYYPYMSENCAKTCGTCGRSNLRSPPPSPPPPPPPYAEEQSEDPSWGGDGGGGAGSGDCRDSDPAECRGYKADGYCDRNSWAFDYMQKNCGATCGFCTVTGPACEDDPGTDCAQYSIMGWCKTKTNIMATLCKRTCNMCGGRRRASEGAGLFDFDQVLQEELGAGSVDGADEDANSTSGRLARKMAL